MPKMEFDLSDAVAAFIAHQTERGHTADSLVTLALADYARRHNLAHVFHPAKGVTAKPDANAGHRPVDDLMIQTVVIAAKYYPARHKVELNVEHPRNTSFIVSIGEQDARYALAQYVDIEDVEDYPDLIGRGVIVRQIGQRIEPIERPREEIDRDLAMLKELGIE